MTWDANPETIAKLRASIAPAPTGTALATVLGEDYPAECRDLPISGGWGYSAAEAVVFVRALFPDPEHADYIPLEYLIAQKIVEEELTIMRPVEQRFAGIDVKLVTQSLEEEGGRTFDCLEFAIVCWSESHWDQLRTMWDENDNGERPGFDKDAYGKMILDSQISYERKFWFDIGGVMEENPFAKLLGPEVK